MTVRARRLRPQGRSSPAGARLEHRKRSGTGPVPTCERRTVPVEPTPEAPSAEGTIQAGAHPGFAMQQR